MLVSFEFKNFLSYNDVCKFTMQATKGTKLSNHLIEPNRLLPIAAIFGGNASGKSNFIKAVNFSKSIILDEEYDYNNLFNLRYRGGMKNDNNIGEFSYLFYVGKKMYQYSIKYDYLNKKIIDENLFKAGNKKLIFQYKKEYIYIEKDLLDQKEKQRMEIYIEDFLSDDVDGTFLNYLYYKNSEKSKFLKLIEGIYNFFDTIVIIEPSSKFVAIDELFLQPTFNVDKILNNYGFDITNYNETEDSISGLLNSEYDELKNKIIPRIKASNKKEFNSIIKNVPYKYKIDENGNLKSYKISFVHKNKEIFEYEDESDGTKRIFDLLPIIHMMKEKNYTFFVDEIDRSLSTHLSYELLRSFINSIEGNYINKQLIFTTHNLQILDFNLLRKDEIWFAENNVELEGSHLRNFNTISFRTDMDLKSAYWKGAIGGVSKRLIETIKKRED